MQPVLGPEAGEVRQRLATDPAAGEISEERDVLAPLRAGAVVLVVAVAAAGVLWRMPAAASAGRQAATHGPAPARRAMAGSGRAARAPSRARASAGQLSLPSRSAVSVQVAASSAQATSARAMSKEIAAHGYHVLSGLVSAPELSPGVYFAPGYSIEAGLLAKALGLPPQDSMALPQPSGAAPTAGAPSPDVVVVLGGGVEPQAGAGG